jgi:hypothetical protein
LRRPVERAEERAGRDGRIARVEDAAADAAGDERPDAAFVAIAFGDDRGAPLRRQRVDLEMRRRAFDLGDQAEDVADREIAQPVRQRPLAPLRVGQRGEQPVERAILAEEEDFVLAAEVVVQVRGREIGGDGDVAHAGGGEAAVAEDLRGRAQDTDAAGVGADRTAVRKLNHRSILH